MKYPFLYPFFFILLFFSIDIQAQMWTPAGKPGFSGADAGIASIAVDASGKPYVAFAAERYYDLVSVMTLNDTGWAFVGVPGFSTGSHNGAISIAINPTSQAPYVSYVEGGGFHPNMNAMRFDGSSWVPVGARGVVIGAAVSPRFIVNKNGIPFVFFADESYDYYAVVRTFNGGWRDYGNVHFSSSGIAAMSMAVDSNGSPIVTYAGKDAISYVMYYDDSAWRPLGPRIEPDSGIGASTATVVDRHGVPYVAYEVSKIYVKKYVGGQWVHVGAPLMQTIGASNICMTIDAADNLYLCYTTDGRLTVMKYDGSNWTTLGTPGFSVYNAAGPSIAVTPDGTPYVAYADPTDIYSITVMRFWTGPVTGVDSICVGITAAFSDATPGGTWASANTEVAIADPQSGVVTGIAPGVTTISYTAAGKLVTKQVTVMPQPVAAAISGPVRVCEGDTILLSCATTGGIWSSSNIADSLSADSLSATAMVTGIALGMDTISYTITNFCATAVATFPVLVHPADSCLPPAPPTSFIVYPSPNSGSVFNIYVPLPVTGEATVFATNMLGQKMMEMKIMTNQLTELSLYVPSGTYIIYAITSYGRYASKIVVRH